MKLALTFAAGLLLGTLVLLWRWAAKYYVSCSPRYVLHDGGRYEH